MPKIIIEKGADKGTVYHLAKEGSYICGRDKDANIKLADSMSSRRHFKIDNKSNGVFISDLKSMNGTFVNGERISETPLKLKINDRIYVGETVLSVISEEEGAKLDTLVGQILGSYRIIEKIGRGGMGTVYKANQLKLNRIIALKVLSDKLVKEAQFRTLFINEARAAAALNHPNIIQVYDVDRINDYFFFSMEFMPGGSIQEVLIKEKLLPPLTSVKMILDSAKGLEYAENNGIVHRDIKPDNLMIAENKTIKIGDLGLATNLREKNITKDQGIFGTPHYVAPEQAMGKDVDNRADIYSLGATFYRMVTGTTPYSGNSIKELILKKTKEDPPPISTYVEDFDPALEDIIKKMMARSVNERYQNATQIIADLDNYLNKPDQSIQTAKESAILTKKTRPEHSTTSIPLSQKATIPYGSKSKNTKTIALIIGAVILGLIILTVIITKKHPPNTPSNTSHTKPNKVAHTTVNNTNLVEEQLQKKAQLLHEKATDYINIKMDIDDATSIKQGIEKLQNVLELFPKYNDKEQVQSKIEELNNRITMLNSKGELDNLINETHNIIDNISKNFTSARFDELIENDYNNIISKLNDFKSRYPIAVFTDEIDKTLSSANEIITKLKEKRKYYFDETKKIDSLLAEKKFRESTDRLLKLIENEADLELKEIFSNKMKQCIQRAKDDFNENVLSKAEEYVNNKEYQKALDILEDAREIYNMPDISRLINNNSKLIKKAQGQYENKLLKQKKQRDTLAIHDILISGYTFAEKKMFKDGRDYVLSKSKRLDLKSSQTTASYYVAIFESLATFESRLNHKLEQPKSSKDKWREIKYMNRKMRILGIEDGNIKLQDIEKPSINADIRWQELSIEKLFDILTENWNALEKLEYDDYRLIYSYYVAVTQYKKATDFLLEYAIPQIKRKIKYNENKNLPTDIYSADLDKLEKLLKSSNLLNKQKNIIARNIRDIANYYFDKENYISALKYYEFLKNHFDTTESYNEQKREIIRRISKCKRKN